LLLLSFPNLDARAASFTFLLLPSYFFLLLWTMQMVLDPSFRRRCRVPTWVEVVRKRRVRFVLGEDTEGCETE
ncbi:hypothetical protein FRC15_008076, partial [Serendipita sp. 397]